MKWFGIGVSGVRKELGAPLRISLQKSVFTPAHGFDGEFSLNAPTEELKYLQGFDGGERVFDGVVDEQRLTADKNGNVLFIAARSRAALLLDNEAAPGSYYMPSLADIVHRHCAPYGFTELSGEGKCAGEFTVGKGVTEWEVLEQFCRSVMGVFPRITDDGAVDASGELSGGGLVVSNRLRGGLRFSSARVLTRRYGAVSEVKYKLTAGGGYGFAVKNEEALGRGICARRLVNLSGLPEWQREYILRRRIEDSVRDYFRITAVLPGVRLLKIGVPAVFSGGLLGQYKSMAVSGVSYRLDASGEQTTVTLHPRGVMTRRDEVNVADTAAL